MYATPHMIIWLHAKQLQRFAVCIKALPRGCRTWIIGMPWSFFLGGKPHRCINWWTIYGSLVLIHKMCDFAEDDLTWTIHVFVNSNSPCPCQIFTVSCRKPKETPREETKEVPQELDLILWSFGHPLRLKTAIEIVDLPMNNGDFP